MREGAAGCLFLPVPLPLLLLPDPLIVFSIVEKQLGGAEVMLEWQRLMASHALPGCPASRWALSTPRLCRHVGDQCKPSGHQ